jgi:glycosyltransferase involved in cell wall biosynthesis
MNIAISCSVFRQSGGMERYALDLVGALNRAGIRPTVFARSFDPELLRRFDIVACRVSVGALPGKLRDHYFSWRVGVLKAQRGIDLLIGATRTRSSDMAICGGTHRGFLQESGRRMKWHDRWQIALESAQYRHARTVVAHSQMMVDELLTLYGVPREKIALLYPPVDAKGFSPATAGERLRLRQHFDLPEDKTVFVFPSSSHHRKGYDRLEAFFERTTLPVLLAVVGRPVSSSSDAIRYLGYQADMGDVYRAADYSILASRYEPFGLVGVESVLCGTPVVFEKRIACTEILSPEACLTFDANLAGDVGRVVELAVARHRSAANHRDVLEPAGAIGYDWDVDHHLKALLSLAERPQA